LRSLYLYDELGKLVTGALYSLLLVADYHTVADGFGGKGYLVGREDDDRLSDIIRQAQRETQKGTATLLNVLIGKTNFREGSISV